MTAQQQATHVFSITLTGNVKAHHGVTVAGAQAGAGVSNAGEVIIGVSDHDGSTGEAARLIIGATAMVVAGAAIDGSEPRLKTAANGFIPWTTGSIVAALLKPGQIAAAAGDLVEVIPVVNK